MTRPYIRSGLLALLLAGAGGADAAAQSTEGILSPAGHLRLEVAPRFHLWDERFGLRDKDGATVEEREPLGYDVEGGPLDLADLRARLRSALAAPALDLGLGSTAAKISRERNEIVFGAALGLFDWLTIGANVPLVQTRTEIAFDFRSTGGALGLRPSTGAISVFRAGLTSSAAAIDARRGQECPAGPGCAALTDLAARYGGFARDLGLAYDAPVFVVQGSAAAQTLEARLAAFREEAAQRAPGVSMPGAAPLATALLSEEELLGLLTGGPPGLTLLRPVQTDMAPFALGDVELTGALRLLEGASRDAVTGRTRFTYRLGLQGLVRLPTGTVDDPDVPLDLGVGDGQMDVELGGFADLRWSRVGVQAEARRGTQQATTLTRRVVPPEVAFAAISTRRDVRWTPGSYLDVEIVPRWHLTDELAVGALLRRFDKDADRYEEVGTVDASLPPASVLERETEMSATEVGLGLGYSTVRTWREGRARVPLEMHLGVQKAVTGSGGATPAGWRLEASGRLFLRLWGRAGAAPE